jgi:hypothetical protein
MIILLAGVLHRPSALMQEKYLPVYSILVCPQIGCQFGQTCVAAVPTGKRSRSHPAVESGILTAMPSKKPNPEPTARSQPVSLAPLSFEEALKALTATPPMTDKPKRPAASRTSKHRTPRKRK